MPTGQLPRVTWCTTGLLSLLPIHAAGCYSRDSPDKRVFNYVVSSYTPTLSALLVPPPSSTAFNGLVSVAQPSTPGQSLLSGTLDELVHITRYTHGLGHTHLKGRQGTIGSVLHALENHSWVHLACHASQDTREPLKSAFHLQDGPLELSTIMQKPLKHAQFAFLSACQTATGDEGLPDEAIHLAAGMLMAGFKSVIATMWSIRDKDAPVVADKVYAHMLEGGVPDCSKAARALHKATQSLRDKIGEREFSAWVPYIHMGL